MVAAMVGDHHLCEPAALGKSGGYGEHYAVAERHHGGVHVILGIVGLGYIVSTGKQRALEIPAHECKVYLYKLYAQTAAV